MLDPRKPIPRKEEGMTRQLDAGDMLPEYIVNTVDGRTLKVPQDLSGEYSVILFYRGSW